MDVGSTNASNTSLCSGAATIVSQSEIMGLL